MSLETTRPNSRTWWCNATASLSSISCATCEQRHRKHTSATHSILGHEMLERLVRLCHKGPARWDVAITRAANYNSTVLQPRPFTHQHLAGHSQSAVSGTYYSKDFQETYSSMDSRNPARVEPGKEMINHRRATGPALLLAAQQQGYDTSVRYINEANPDELLRYSSRQTTTPPFFR